MRGGIEGKPPPGRSGAALLGMLGAGRLGSGGKVELLLLLSI